jgi:NADH:ubiquinone reductase (H+-translocating)
MRNSGRPQVLVVGAGFAGLAAVSALAGSTADVTLVDQNIYSTFQPLLYQVATGGLNPGDVSYPIRSFARKRRVRFRRGRVASIEAEPARVVLDDGGSLSYDYLVVTSGAAANYFGVAGASEHSLSLYRRGDAIAIRDALMGRFEALAAGEISELRLVIIGGGPTGVEMAGTLAELRNAGLGEVYPEIERGSVEVVLIEQGDELLAPFDPGLRRYTLAELQKREVDVRLRCAVTALAPGQVTLGDGETVASNLTIWAAGVGVGDWGFPRGRGGRISVNEDLRIEGYDRVFAAGDAAICAADPMPQLAQPAIQTGRHAGRQVRRLIEGQATQAFHYKNKGTMATIGRRAAVAELPFGIRLRGTLAWLAWLGLHIVTLLGNRNRVSALLNLSWRYVNWPTGSGVIVGDVPEPETTRAH